MDKRERVLVVEDDAAVGQAIVDLLADEGYQVRWATDGRAALAVLGGWRPAVILLDLMMPVMDGRAFRAAQRGLDGPTARVPVIVLSGAREARAAAADLEAAAALTKPFDLEELLATVGHVLEQHPT